MFGKKIVSMVCMLALLIGSSILLDGFSSGARAEIPMENGRIHGFVLNETGVPVEDVWVDAYTGRNYDNATNRSWTDVDGYYEISSLRWDTYEVRASAEGYFDNTTEVVIDSNNPVWVNFTLFRMPEVNSTVCGYVLNETGNASVPDMMMFYERTGLWMGQIIVNETTGFYNVSLFGSDYLFFIFKEGYETNMSRLTVGWNMTVWHNITLFEEVSIVCGFVNWTNNYEDTTVVAHSRYRFFEDNIVVADSETGYYEIPVGAGGFVLFAYCGEDFFEGDSQYEPVVDEILVGVNETFWYNITLLPKEEMVNVAWGNISDDWNSLSIDIAFVMGSINQSKLMRLNIEYMCGDGDGYLSDEEFNTFIEMTGDDGDGMGEDMFGDNTTEILLIDDIWFDTVSQSSGMANFLGYWYEDVAISMVGSASFTANQTIGVAGEHMIDFYVNYTDMRNMDIIISFGEGYEVYSSNFINVNITGTNPVTLSYNGSDAGGEWVTVYVRDVLKPLAVAGNDRIVEIGTNITLDGSMSLDNCLIINYTWTIISDSNITYLYGVVVNYSFNETGLFNITLTVTDLQGNTDDDNLSVFVRFPYRTIAVADRIIIQRIKTDELTSMDANIRIYLTGENMTYSDFYDCYGFACIGVEYNNRMFGGENMFIRGTYLGDYHTDILVPNVLIGTFSFKIYIGDLFIGSYSIIFTDADYAKIYEDYSYVFVVSSGKYGYSIEADDENSMLKVFLNDEVMNNEIIIDASEVKPFETDVKFPFTDFTLWTTKKMVVKLCQTEAMALTLSEDEFEEIQMTVYVDRQGYGDSWNIFKPLQVSGINWFKADTTSLANEKSDEVWKLKCEEQEVSIKYGWW